MMKDMFGEERVFGGPGFRFKLRLCALIRPWLYAGRMLENCTKGLD